MKKVIIAVIAAVLLFVAGFFGYRAYMDGWKDGDYYLINSEGERISNISFMENALLFENDFGGALVRVENRWPKGHERYKKADAVINSEGKIVLGPTTSTIHYLKNDLFSIGYDIYDATGKKIGTADSSDIGRFAENGLATIKVAGMTACVGYIDKTGNCVIDTIFEDGKIFGTNGLAAVMDENGLWGYIDETGSYVIEPQYSIAGTFSEGMAAVQTPDGKWSYIRENGETAFEVNCSFAEDFRNGYAVLVKNSDKKIIIDTNGNAINDEVYDNYPEFSVDGIAGVSTKDGYCFIDGSGSLVFDKVFQHYEDSYNSGIYAVQDENGLWGYIGSDGEWIIEPAFEEAGAFDSEGKVAVVKSAK